MKRRSTSNKTSDQPVASGVSGPASDIQPLLRDDGGALLRPDPMTGSPDDEVLHHLSSLLDSVKTGIISLDGEGRIRVFNAVAEVLFAVRRQAVLGRPFSAMGRMISFKGHSLHALWERLADAVWAAGAALDLETDLVHPTGQGESYPTASIRWGVWHGPWGTAL